MAQGEFLWCDLATFDVEQTLAYYRQRFDWVFKSEEFPDGSVYHYASGANDVTAGIYEMPTEFKKQGVQSYWMSYIGVDDIVASCEKVEELGGKVLLGPAMFGRGAAIALIEDPTGARFTFFTGSYLQPRSSKMAAGSNHWNELYTPDPDAVAQFYQGLFGWKIAAADETGRRLVHNLAGSPTTAIQDNAASPAPLDQAQWTVSFAMPNLEQFVEALASYDRERMIWIKNRKGAAVCITDPNGAAYVVAQLIEESGWFG